jgi:hypothetical protein
LLLLVVVAVGVVQMHASGHLGTDHGMRAEVAPAVAHAMVGASASLSSMSVDAGADETPGSGGQQRSLELLGVCLAILAAAGLAAAALLLVRRAVGGAGGGIGPPPRRWFGRDPPWLVLPLGRRLADLSVLRI